MSPRRRRRPCPPLETLHGLLDGTLRPRERRSCEAHLRGCAPCADRLEEARALLGAARGLGEAASREWERASAPPPSRRPEALPPRARGLEIGRLVARGPDCDLWLAAGEEGPLVVGVHRAPPDRTLTLLEGLRLYERTARDPQAGLVPVCRIGRCEETGRAFHAGPRPDPLGRGGGGEGGGEDRERYKPATLEAWVRRHGPLDAPGARAVARDLLASLGKLHAMGYAHGRIEGWNLLRHGGRWRPGPNPLRPLGTVAAGPPGAPPPPPPPGGDPRADLHALGRILYQMLNGGLAGFPTPGGEHVRPGREGRAYRAIYRVIERACAPRRADRYASAAEMERDLLPPGGISRWRRLLDAARRIRG